jgi:hypothetical protein
MRPLAGPALAVLGACSFRVDLTTTDGGPVADATCQATYAERVLADRPLLYLRFDDDQGPVLIDSSGHDAPAVVDGEAVFGVPGGLAGDDSTALACPYPAPTTIFSAHVRFAELPASWADDFTMELLVRPLAVREGDDRGAIMVAEEYGVNGFRLAFTGGRIELRCSQDPCPDPPIAGAPVAMGEWLHVVLVYDAPQWRIHVGGALYASGTLPSYLPPEPGGFFGPAQGMHMSAQIDEAALYQGVLPAGRITRHALVAAEGPSDCP